VDGRSGPNKGIMVATGHGSTAGAQVSLYDRHDRSFLHGYGVRNMPFDVRCTNNLPGL